MSIFKKSTTPTNTTTYKSMGSHYTADHDTLTLTYGKFATNGTYYDCMGEGLTIPAEWIDHAEANKSRTNIYLVNHGSTPLPSMTTTDLWSFTTDKKSAPELADDINRMATQARAQYPNPRPFTVPQPIKDKLDAVQRKRKKDHPTAIQFGTMMLLDGTVYYGGYAIDAATATATMDTGMADQSKVGAGRVIGGAILAGPAGAIIGAAAKKNVGEVFVIVTAADGRVLMTSAPSKESGSAVSFVNAVGSA